MSTLSAGLAKTLKVFQKLTGQTVTFNGVDYTLINTEQVSGALAGEQGVPRLGLGVDIASTAPRLFVFSPFDFAPYTDVAPPQNGNFLVWCGWNYRVTNPDLSNMSTDTLGILIYALRAIEPF
jgi:hypothetical protein